MEYLVVALVFLAFGYFVYRRVTRNKKSSDGTVSGGGGGGGGGKGGTVQN